MCYIKPESIETFGREKKVYKYHSKLKLRTQTEFDNYYNSNNNLNSINGVKKGKPFLNNFINFPDQVLLDYMHVCVRGPQQLLLSIWLNPENRSEDYYLGINYLLFTCKLLDIYLRFEIKYETKFV